MVPFVWRAIAAITSKIYVQLVRYEKQEIDQSEIVQGHLASHSLLTSYCRKVKIEYFVSLDPFN